jgi:cytoskeleton protein RodZ
MQHIMADDVGGRLRRAREQRGLSLRDAAHRTKLSIFALEAIERNDFGRLPGGMFRRAYVRTLAAEVGLDPGELASEYCARFEPPREEPAPPQRQGRRVDSLLAATALAIRRRARRT